MALARAPGHLLAAAWHDLVRAFAEMAARDPARRLARLEAPPVIPGAASNPKWSEADLRYRQAVRQLEGEIREAQQRRDAPWWAIGRAVFSSEGIRTLFLFLLIYFVLNALGLTTALWEAAWGILVDVWKAL
jgi:hypothetical protein